MLEQHIFQGDGGGQALPQPVLVEQVADLDADLGVFVRVEGGDAALGGAKGLAAQALLLVAVLGDGGRASGSGPAPRRSGWGRGRLAGDGAQLVHQLLDIQCHAVADDVGHMGIEGAGGEDVQGEPAIVVDDGMARVGPPEGG